MGKYEKLKDSLHECGILPETSEKLITMIETSESEEDTRIYVETAIDLVSDSDYICEKPKDTEYGHSRNMTHLSAAGTAAGYAGIISLNNKILKLQKEIDDLVDNLKNFKDSEGKIFLKNQIRIKKEKLKNLERQYKAAKVATKVMAASTLVNGAKATKIAIENRGGFHKFANSYNDVDYLER